MSQNLFTEMNIAIMSMYLLVIYEKIMQSKLLHKNQSVF